MILKSQKFSFVSKIVLLGFLLSSGLMTFSQSVNELLKQANTDLRNAQNRFFSGKYDETAQLLENVSKTIEQIKASDPENSQLKSLEQKYARQKADLDRRMPKPASSSQSMTAPAPGQSQPSEGEAKLPSGVTYRLKNLNSELDRAERILSQDSVSSAESKAKQAEYQFNQAKTYMDEIQQKFAGQYSEDHPDMKIALERMAAVEKDIAAFAAGAQKAIADKDATKKAGEEVSAKWMARFQPYLEGPGQDQHNPEKYFIAGGTSNPEELLQRKRLYDELSKLFEEYKNSGTDFEKTWQLEQAEEKISYALTTFSGGYEESLKGMKNEAKTKLEEGLNFLEQDQGWRSDLKIKPKALPKDQVESIRALIDTVAQVQKDSSEVTELNQGYAKLLQQQEERNKVIIERTFMTSDQYSGQDLKPIKSKAEEIVGAKIPGAKVLRTTVISKDWKEEDVVEWTDTTKTAAKHRITRSLSAQVAAKQDNSVFLYTLFIGKDKQSDGSWSALYGHIMFTDQMLEQHVSR